MWDGTYGALVFGGPAEFLTRVVRKCVYVSGSGVYLRRHRLLLHHHRRSSSLVAY